jgi:hypothetical protein
MQTLTYTIINNCYGFYIKNIFKKIFVSFLLLTSIILSFHKDYLSIPPVLVGFVLLDLLFYKYVLSIVVCSFGHCVVCSSSIYGLIAPLLSSNSSYMLS